MENGRQKSWFSKNWGWLLGGGCLTLIVIVVLGVGGLIYKVSDSITNSEPYNYAYTTAKENNEVISYLGSPIETNGMGNTSFSMKNGETEARLNIPIKGSENKGTIVVEGNKIDGVWSYETLEVHIDNEDHIIKLLEQIEGDLDNL